MTMISKTKANETIKPYLNKRENEALPKRWLLVRNTNTK